MAHKLANISLALDSLDPPPSITPEEIADMKTAPVVAFFDTLWDRYRPYTDDELLGKFATLSGVAVDSYDALKDVQNH